jgi:amino acid permease
MAQPKGTFVGTIATVTNNVIGAGLLSLPYTFKRASLVPGASAMAVTGVLNCASMLLLGKCAALTGATSYRDLSEIAFGSQAATVLAAIMALYTLGSCISYIILLGDALPELLANAHATGTAADFVTRNAVIPIAAAAVLLPLTLQRNLSALRYTSVASFVCICYTAGMIVVRAIVGPRAPIGDDPTTDVIVARGGAGLFIGLPITMVAFTMHYNSPRFYAELQPSLRNMRTFLAIGTACFSFTAIVYEATASSGYLLFGGNTKGDVLENFADDDVPAFIARVALIVVMLFSYPLAFNSYRASCVALLPKQVQRAVNEGSERLAAAVAEEPELTRLRYLQLAAIHNLPFAVVTVALIGATVALAIALPSLEVVLGYKGALGGSLIVYVFPGLMYASIMRQIREGRIVPPDDFTAGGSSDSSVPGSSLVSPSGASVISASSSNTPLLWGSSPASVSSEAELPLAKSKANGKRLQVRVDGSDDPAEPGADGEFEQQVERRQLLLTTPSRTPSSGVRSSDSLNRSIAPAAEWSAIFADLVATHSGRLGLVATAYGLTILVLGTATTAGLLQ